MTSLLKQAKQCLNVFLLFVIFEIFLAVLAFTKGYSFSAHLGFFVIDDPMHEAIISLRMAALWFAVTIIYGNIRKSP